MLDTDLRTHACNRAPITGDGDYVLYWMVGQRRVRWNFALERAVSWATELGKPLLVLEGLRCGYPWASDRLHRFVLQGMAVHQKRLAATPVTYYPYVERRPNESRGLLETLAKKACVVVTDDFPSFFVPRMVKAAAAKLSVRLEKVDSNGLLPLAATDRVFLRAVDFRRFLQKELAGHLPERPQADPLASVELATLDGLPAPAIERWAPATAEMLEAGASFLADLPIDHSVRPVAYDGGSEAAEAALDRFIAGRLQRYADGRNALIDRATSGLSPYLHFGHISSHQIFAAIADREGWHPGLLADRASGARAGWWGMSPEAEAFLDQLVTWRELGYNMSALRNDVDKFDSLPAWAQATLDEHRQDPRPDLYSPEDLEGAHTHDEVWNAAQRELVRDGTIHNYLRMLWGKKILEWSPTPRDAARTMVMLNDKYAVDGRNPNSYSGIFWCLGRYDRAWGPERPIFGKIRYMSSDNTKRKLPLAPYLAEFGPLSLA